jgi:hypothetical protein
MQIALSGREWEWMDGVPPKIKSEKERLLGDRLYEIRAKLIILD